MEGQTNEVGGRETGIVSFASSRWGWRRGNGQGSAESLLGGRQAAGSEGGGGIAEISGWVIHLSLEESERVRA